MSRTEQLIRDAAASFLNDGEEILAAVIAAPRGHQQRIEFVVVVRDQPGVRGDKSTQGASIELKWLERYIRLRQEQVALGPTPPGSPRSSPTPASPASAKPPRSPSTSSSKRAVIPCEAPALPSRHTRALIATEMQA